MYSARELFISSSLFRRFTSGEIFDGPLMWRPTGISPSIPDGQLTTDHWENKI